MQPDADHTSTHAHAHAHSHGSEAAWRAVEIDAAQVLRAHELRVTGQRLEVLEALAGAPGDTTAQGLHERLRSTGSSIGVATVYRTLNSLAEAGVIDSMQHGASVCFRLCAPGHHHHLTCSQCHAVVELHDCGVDEWAQQVAKLHGFDDVAHTVELTGVCASCRAA